MAITRARTALLLSGAAWGDGVRSREPSRFLREIAELAQGPGAQALVVGDWHEVADGASNPREELRRSVPWPADPLGERRGRIEAAAVLVRSAMAGLDAAQGRPGEPDDEDGWDAEVSALLAERDLRRSGVALAHLPGHLSASRMVQLAADPAGLAVALRRPMPRPPSPQARRGSAFHAWLEQRFGAAALVDVDELPGAADGSFADDGDEELTSLQKTFLASAWADRTPYAVEVAVETPVSVPSQDGSSGPGADATTTLMLRGRVDAVYRRERGGRGGPDWEVVDWKTGAPPATQPERSAAAVQLAVYRLAWAAVVGVAPERVSGAFYYAATGRTVRPVDLLDGPGLSALIADAVRRPGAPGDRRG